MSESFFDRVHKNDTLHSPDVLSCLANLSNDEVFTPPEVVNQMLDMLPQHLFSDPSAKFLDPACKTGVFLREIAKRLLVGLEPLIPDLEERIEHIYKNQLYGIAITELTSLLSRRSLYCSKYPNGEYSICKFDNPEGNIRFKKIQHTWENGKCIYCNVPKNTKLGDEIRIDNLETHAYEFIHNSKEIFKMKFDVIISNPPYQLNDGGAQASAIPIYQFFIQMSKKLNPRYISMIVPSRWMTGGKGLDEFRKEMINDRHIIELHDFYDASMCFSGVDIKGGVCYFLWSKETEKKCNIYSHYDEDHIFHSYRYLVDGDDDIFIRDSRLINIKNKVKVKNQASFSTIITTRKPYGLRSDFFSNPKKYGLPEIYERPFHNGITIHGLLNLKRVKRFVQKYPFPLKEGLEKYKIFISESYGSGKFGEVPAKYILAGPNEACTETFLQVGPFNNEEERDNCYTYMKTKFFRSLVGIRKMTQHATQSVYQYVPLQDFSKAWTDHELYKIYKLSKEEIEFIEDNVLPMED